MPKIFLYPRAARGDRLRVWLGVFQVTAAPALDWSLDGAPAQPTALRALSSIRSDDMLPANVPRAFTGVYEFTGLQPDTPHRVAVRADAAATELDVRTLPDAVTSELDRSFNVLLASCFHQAEDRGGLAGIVVSQLKATSKPHLTILAGDQVYLDLPTLKNFPDDLALLAEKFEQDYRLNWCGPQGYERVLAAAPSVSIPDDHEYWNNFPHPSPIIQNSLTQGGLNAYRDAESYPNVAVLKIPVAQKEAVEALSRFEKQRAVLDTVDLTVHWLAYLWGVANSPNPLSQRQGVPSAAMLEVVVGAAGYDITPSLESRSSCPEAIWQAAKWWHLYYGDQNRTELSGAYHVGHRLE
jgi:hypothetical protein